MLLSTLATQTLAAPTDISNHWAKASIEKLIDYGIMQGNGQGRFNPNSLITRAECVALINRSFNFDKNNNIAFEDVQSGAWYAEEFSKAATQGYIEGNGGKVLPKELVTREEVAHMFSRVLKLSSYGTLLYTDEEAISEWAKESVAILTHQGIMQGNKGEFNPKDGITRAEVATVLDRAIGNLYDTAQVYDEKGKTLSGNVTINSSGVVLENATIKGNLYITEGVGMGEVTLNNVVIEGETIVSGGGMDSIVFISTKAGVVKIEVPDNTPVRLVASGDTAIGEVKAQSESKLEESNLTGEGFKAVTINIPEGAKVSLSGDFDKVDMVSGNAKLDVLEGSIKALNVEATGKDAQIKLAQGVVVDTMVCNGAAKVSGTGVIQSATINVSGVEMAQVPKHLEIKEGIKADIKGKIVDKDTANKTTDNTSDKNNNSNQGNSNNEDTGDSGSTSKPIDTKILELELSNVEPKLDFKSDNYVYTTTRSGLYDEMILKFRTGRGTRETVTLNDVAVSPDNNGNYRLPFAKEKLFTEIVITITEAGNSQNKTVYMITVDNELKNRVEKDSYIYNPAKDGDLKVKIYPRENASVKSLLLGQEILEVGKDYTLQGNEMNLMQAFLISKQGMGRLNFTICFTEGNDVKFEVLVADDKPVYLGELALIDDAYALSMAIPLIHEDQNPVEGKLAFLDRAHSEIELLNSEGAVLINSQGQPLKKSFEELEYEGNGYFGGGIESVATGYTFKYSQMEEFLRAFGIRTNALVPAAIRVKVVKNDTTGNLQVSESIKALEIPKTEYKLTSVTLTQYNEGKPIAQNNEVDQTKQIQSLQVNDLFKLEYTGQGVKSYSRDYSIQSVGQGYKGFLQQGQNKMVATEYVMLYEKGKMPVLFDFELSYTENAVIENRFITEVRGEVVENPDYQYVLKLGFGNAKEKEISYKDAVEKYYLRPELLTFYNGSEGYHTNEFNMEHIKEKKAALDKVSPDIERVVIETTASAITLKIKDIGAFFEVFEIDPKDYTAGCQEDFHGDSCKNYKQWIFDPSNKGLEYWILSGLDSNSSVQERGTLAFEKMTAYPTDIKIKNWTENNTGTEIATVKLNNEIDTDSQYYTDQYKVEITTSSGATTTSSTIRTTASSIDISLDVVGMSDKGVVKYYDEGGYELATNKIIVTPDLIPGKDYNTWVNVVVTEPGREMRRYRLNIYRADSQ